MEVAPARLFWPAVIGLLAYLAIVQIRSAEQESVTADEPVQIACGYRYLTSGDFRLEPVHPPLDKMFAALPLLRFGIVMPPPDSDEVVYGTQWMAANARKEDGIVLAARLTSIFLTGCLGLAIVLWTRASFGPGAALLALTLFAFDPTITAHGRYVKNDVPFTLCAFLACIAFAAYLKRPALKRLVLAAVAFGIAMATKLAAFFLLPVFVLIYAAWRWRGHKMRSLARDLLAFAAMLFLSACVVFAVYEIPALVHGVPTGGVNRPIIHALLDRSTAGAAARLTSGPPPAHPFLRGLVVLADLNAAGHPAYLFGKVRTTGWWYYFPVAFAVKTPVGTLILLFLAFGLCLYKLLHGPCTYPGYQWVVLAIPVGVYAAFTLTTPINVGVRHLLPILPFLYILAAAALTRVSWRYRPIILPILCAGLAAESIAIYPHYLAFFNVLAGGPANGPRILADSNVDWGQDAKHLAAWIRAHHPIGLSVDYWGAANLARLGISAPSLIERLREAGHIPQQGIDAVSVNLLDGLAPDHGEFGWLRTMPPIARIGYSIYVFDLAKTPIAASIFLSGTMHPAFRTIWHQDFRGYPSPRDPAKPGEILTAYMTGLGPVTQPVPPGRPTPLDLVSTTVMPLVCQWDATGLVADVLFAGLAPGQVGVYQINLRVPPNAKTGQLSCRSALGGPSAAIAVAVAAQ